jgi:hypothetical protein
MEVDASTNGVAVRVNLTFGCAMGNATFGDVGHTIVALGGLCGILAEEDKGLCPGKVVGLPVYHIGGGKGCCSGVLVGQNAAV